MQRWSLSAEPVLWLALSCCHSRQSASSLAYVDPCVDYVWLLYLYCHLLFVVWITPLTTCACDLNGIYLFIYLKVYFNNKLDNAAEEERYLVKLYLIYIVKLTNNKTLIKTMFVCLLNFVIVTVFMMSMFILRGCHLWGFLKLDFHKQHPIWTFSGSPINLYSPLQLRVCYPYINNIRKKGKIQDKSYIQISSCDMQVKIFNPEVSYRKPVALLDVS